MIKKLEAKERIEEERIRRRAKKKDLQETSRVKALADIKDKEKRSSEIKAFKEIKKTKKLKPVILHPSKSPELVVSSLKETPVIETVEKIKPAIIHLSRHTKLRIPSIGEFSEIDYNDKVKPLVIKAEIYSPKLIISDLEEVIIVENLPRLNYRKILGSPIMKITPPEIISKKVHLSKVLSIPIYKEQAIVEGESIGEVEKEKARVDIAAKETDDLQELESLANETKDEEEVPDFFEVLFSGVRGGKIDSGEPKVICMKEIEDDSYIGALMTICTRIYREKKGGNPKPIVLSHLTEDFKSEITKWLKAENKIFTVKLNDDDWKELNEDDWKHISDRMAELFAQGFGFIIFNKPILFFPECHQIDIINIEPTKLDLELKKNISSIIWGFVNLKESEESDFDHIFERARRKFTEKLMAFEEPYISVTKRHREEESELHYAIKLFLVKLLAKKMKLRSIDRIKDEIKVEEAYNGVYPDIYLKNSSEAYEVETLFGEGSHPIKKIDETIEKYEKRGDIRKVNVVLDNLTLLRYIKALMKKKYLHKVLQKTGKRSFDLEFLTLDIENLGLININKVAEKVNEIAKGGGFHKTTYPT